MDVPSVVVEVPPAVDVPSVTVDVLPVVVEVPPAVDVPSVAVDVLPVVVEVPPAVDVPSVAVDVLPVVVEVPLPVVVPVVSEPEAVVASGTVGVSVDTLSTGGGSLTGVGAVVPPSPSWFAIHSVLAWSQ